MAKAPQQPTTGIKKPEHMNKIELRAHKLRLELAARGALYTEQARHVPSSLTREESRALRKRITALDQEAYFTALMKAGLAAK